ncbi:E3 ubiquitin-protein ligase TRIM33-like isoform X3 [Polyodon spathula]|uniref:E3 ubiquitin-protein ligase TRIM33-like isoform X3 n=1 Tax=Polyodon spathula TaxID=7913 RepID=UPI001B7F60C9|nr:E3 ubiquitin-protein ligase TRIM33-like isoform X3 [Polyodon spathula]
MALNSDKFLQCGVCSCSITSPKLLSCLHSFCQTCLRDQGGSHVVTCPTCHQPTEKAEVKDNKLLSDLQSKLDILRQIGRVGYLSCSCCNASAGSMCFECEKFLCQKCFEAHQVFIAKDSHLVESLESLKVMSSQEFLATARKKRQPYCPNHDKETISIFCRTCAKSICTTCTVLMHKPPDHEYRDIKQEAQEQKDNLHKMCTKLCKKEDAFKDILKKLLNLKGDHQSQKKELEEQIKVSVKEAVRKLEQKGEDLLKELEGIYKGMDAKMSKKLLHMEDVQKRIEGSKDLVEKMIKYATDEEVMEMQAFVKSSLQQLQRSKPGNANTLDFTVEFKKTDLEQLNLLGSLMTSTPIKTKRERQDDEDIKPGTSLASEPPPKRPYTPSLEKPGFSPASLNALPPNVGQQSDDSLLDYNDDDCEETQSGTSDMLNSGEENDGDMSASQSHLNSSFFKPNLNIETCTLVFFDLETTGQERAPDIIQLSAIGQDKIFNISIRHSQHFRGSLFHLVQTKTRTEALTAFLAFLRALVQPTILVGHNIWKNKCPILCRHLDELGLKDQLQESVSGFLDTESLARDNLKGKDIKKFSQQDLAKVLLKKSYPAHNTLAAVRNLQELYQSLRPAQEKHLFSLVQLEAHISLQPLVLAMAVTKPSAQTLAQQGISLETMKRAYQEDPKKGLKHLLRHLLNELGPSKLSTIVRNAQTFFFNQS